MYIHIVRTNPYYITAAMLHPKTMSWTIFSSFSVHPSPSHATNLAISPLSFPFYTAMDVHYSLPPVVLSFTSFCAIFTSSPDMHTFAPSSSYISPITAWYLAHNIHMPILIYCLTRLSVIFCLVFIINFTSRSNLHSLNNNYLLLSLLQEFRPLSLHYLPGVL